MVKTSYLVCASLGISSTLLLPLEPSWPKVLLLLLCLLPGLFIRSKPAIIALTLGLMIGLLQQAWLYTQLIPIEWDRQVFKVRGRIVSLVQDRGYYQRFRFQTEQLSTVADQPLSKTPLLLLSWYKPNKIRLKPGQQLQLTVSIRRPRGLVNPASFDYENWLISSGIQGTGSIRSIETIQPPKLAFGLASLHYLRSRLVDLIHTGQPPETVNTARAIATALAIGEQSLITPQVWDLFHQAGIVHLMVISGLHIGLIASIFYLIGTGLGRGLNLTGMAIRASYCGYLLSWAGAFIYSLFSGLSIATLRAMIMLSVFIFCRLYCLHIRPSTLFVIALTLVLVCQPLAPLQRGFWLSFAAVGVLMFYFNCHSITFTGRVWNWLISLVKTQWALLLGYSTLLLLSLGYINLLGPFINILAVPFIGLLVVPLVLLSLLLTLIDSRIGNLLWPLVDYLLDLFIAGLKQLEPLWYIYYNPEHHWLLWLISGVAGLFLLLPSQLPWRRWAFLGLLPLFIVGNSSKPALVISMLDVGQGLSVVVEGYSKNGEHYSLVYDTGRHFSDRFDSGADIIAPYLRSRGLNQLDQLVVSHSDSDHDGGVTGLLGKIPAQTISVGMPLKYLKRQQQQACNTDASWRWEHLNFQFLHPEPNAVWKSNNDKSCVLLITYKDQRILLTGDISDAVEKQFLDCSPIAATGHAVSTPKRPIGAACRYREAIKDVDVLLVPHHGSNTSSSKKFIAHTNPGVALISSAFKNRYQHPHPKVLSRYASAAPDSILFNTAESGAVQLQWPHRPESSLSHEDDHPYSIIEWRKRRYFWWNW